MSEERKFIEEALNNHKPAIDSYKKDEWSMSSYTVEKPWGKEEWLELTDHYCMKRISMNKGAQSSLQVHKYKKEINYVLEGTVRLLIGEKVDSLEERVITAGGGWIVPPGVIHRVIAETDYVAIEASTPHLDDVTRLQDDLNRPDGLIEGEHNANQ
jgi:mannose-6-phosphate isomerase-like protein (cupin superfamily)